MSVTKVLWTFWPPSTSPSCEIKIKQKTKFQTHCSGQTVRNYIGSKRLLLQLPRLVDIRIVSGLTRRAFVMRCRHLGIQENVNNSFVAGLGNVTCLHVGA